MKSRFANFLKLGNLATLEQDNHPWRLSLLSAVCPQLPYSSPSQPVPSPALAGTELGPLKYSYSSCFTDKESASWNCIQSLFCSKLVFLTNIPCCSLVPFWQGNKNVNGQDRHIWVIFKFFICQRHPLKLTNIGCSESEYIRQLQICPKLLKKVKEKYHLWNHGPFLQ